MSSLIKTGKIRASSASSDPTVIPYPVQRPQSLRNGSYSLMQQMGVKTETFDDFTVRGIVLVMASAPK